jgi:hypothetical protein
MGYGGRSLANCHGFLVVSTDGAVGEVAALLFPPDSAEPDFLVIKTRAAQRERRPIVPAGLVADVDPLQRIVRLATSGEDVARAPERLPIAELRSERERAG